MNIVALSRLREFWKVHADAEAPLRAWHAEVSKAKWTGPQDIKDRYASASFVGVNRVCFNIKGNTYRLIVAVAYRKESVFIKFFGTHAEYDKIDAATVEIQ